MKLLKYFSKNFMQQVRSFLGIESPSLKQRKLAKRMVEEMGEVFYGGKEETNQAK